MYYYADCAGRDWGLTDLLTEAIIGAILLSTVYCTLGLVKSLSVAIVISPGLVVDLVKVG